MPIDQNICLTEYLRTERSCTHALFM